MLLANSVARELALRTLVNDMVASGEFVASGEDIILLQNAEMTKCAMAWGAQSSRTRDVAFVSRPKFTSGALDARMNYSAI